MPRCIDVHATVGNLRLCKNLSLRAVALMLLGLLAGCANRPGTDTDVSFDATETPSEIRVDGRLDEPVWQSTKAYSLLVPGEEGAGTPAEAATVRLLWDANYLYVGLTLEDRDIVQEEDRDQQHHYTTGDVIEVFLKPHGEGQTHYWELYVTPQGRQTAFLYPGRGRLGLPSNMSTMPGLKTAAQIQGTLNVWQDDDRGWSAEMAVPRAALAVAGSEMGSGRPWKILIARYNYGRHLSRPELTSFPRMPRGAWHEHEHWTPLVGVGR